MAEAVTMLQESRSDRPELKGGERANSRLGRILEEDELGWKDE
jgi:hypothetical protein